MCGRIILTNKPKAIGGFQHDLDFEAWQGPRFNISPAESVATLLNDGSHVVQLTHWGLIPSWAKDISIGNRMINARAETLTEKPAFKGLIRTKRCVILADGFYEWKVVHGGKAKQPMLIRLKTQEDFAFAGLWDSWKAEDGSEIVSSTIITTTPNELMSTVHNRMPVILQPECVARWLSSDAVSAEQLISCLTPFPDSLMEMYPVSTLVNKPGVNQPECIQPVITL